VHDYLFVSGQIRMRDAPDIMCDVVGGGGGTCHDDNIGIICNVVESGSVL